MKWKMVCASAAVLVFVGMAVSETYNGFITEVKDGKVTFQKTKKGEKVGDPFTLPVAEDVKVANRKKDDKKFVAGDEIKGGIKAEVFQKIDEKGLPATITTDGDNKKITEILVGKKK